MPNTDKQLAELLVEEKKLLEQQKKEQGALKQKLRAVKKQLREEERRLNVVCFSKLIFPQTPCGTGGSQCRMKKFNLTLKRKRPSCKISMVSCRSRKNRELFGLG